MITLEKWEYRVLGVLLCGGGFAMFWFFQLSPWLQCREILSSWRETPALILANQYVSGDGETASFNDIEYEYRFGAQAYRSRAAAIWPHRIETHFGLKPGSTTGCRVNPARPAEAVLAADFAWNWVPITVAGMFLLAGLFAVAAPAFAPSGPPEPIFSGDGKLPPGVPEVLPLPKCPEGSAYRVFELCVHDWGLEYRVRTMYRGVVTVFALAGAGLTVYGLTELRSGRFLMLISGAVMLVIGIKARRRLRRERPRFDLLSGFYCNDSRSAAAVADPRELVDYTPLREVVALQLLAAEIRPPEQGDDSESSAQPYTCYELNLVRRDGSRTHVTAHPNRKILIADAQTIAVALRVPIIGRI